MKINQPKQLIKYFFILITISISYSFVSDDKTLEEHIAEKEFFHLQKESHDWVDSIFNSLSLDEKIAQLFMVQAYSNKGGISEPEAQNITQLVEKYKIGGLIFFQGGPAREAILTNYYQSKSKVPLMIAIDGEWGLGMRLDSTISYPRQMMLGAIQNEKLLFEMGVEIARQCQRTGIHINFAPVVDINNNPNNPVINSRSFGENKFNVARKGIQYMLGMQSMHLLTTAKHFPGHGDTDVDSHKDLPVIQHSIKRLDSLELYPFKQLFDNGLTGIMVAHLNIPALEPKANTASTLSHNIVTNILKKKMKFKGLIFTDALNMKGVSKYFAPGEVDLKALQAGNDVLLYPADVPVAIERIKKAINTGELKQSVIDERCKKILIAKKWMGLDTIKKIKVDSIYQDLNSEYAHNLNARLIENSLTLLENKNNTIPIGNLAKNNIAIVTIGQSQKSKFQTTCELYTKTNNFNIEREATIQEFNLLIEKLNDYNTIIIGLINTNERPSKNFGVTDNSISFIDSLSNKKNVVLAHFANPYSLAKFKNTNKLQALLLCYQDNEAIQHAAAQLIFGGIPALGKLPVSIGNIYKSGEGIIIPKAVRLKYSTPIDVGMNSQILNRIDSIANNAIEQKATPGCQILVARNNTVIFNKSYGYHTYNKQINVTETDLYDLASITKILSSVNSIMYLYDNNKFKLDTTLSFYLPELDTTNKGKLWIKDILTHQARLKPWIPFYLSLIKDYDNPEEKIISKWYSDMYSVKLGKACYLRSDFQYRDSILSDSQTDTFTIEVAKNVYMNKFWIDTIFRKIRESDLEVKKEYKYSDLGYYYFKQIIEQQTGEPLENYVKNTFFEPLGAFNINYHPLKHYDINRIIPTEDDKIFRKQLLQGYVHDPGAAMLGGVGGHAGLFGNANDIAKIMQMYLNKGIYGDCNFFKPSTINLFTSCPFCDQNNRRGIGFDKPNPDTTAISSVAKSCSLESYGHSGFTGTLAWVDPKYNLIYIFLSNRIHPDTDNSIIYNLDVRPSIHQTIYDAIEN